MADRARTRCSLAACLRADVSGVAILGSGLGFLVAYTWSKTLTDAESQFSEFSGFTADPYNRKAEKSYSINDHPHNLVTNWVYELPFGPGKKFAKAGGPEGKIVGGWKIAGIQQ